VNERGFEIGVVGWIQRLGVDEVEVAGVEVVFRGFVSSRSYIEGMNKRGSTPSLNNEWLGEA
jgi:hypothetical protein